MAARSSLIRFSFVCIVLAVLVMTAESQNGANHGPAKAPSSHGSKAHAPAPHGHKAHGPSSHGHKAPAPAPHGPNAPAPAPHGPHAPAPARNAASFSAYPQLIATALVGALSFVF